MLDTKRVIGTMRATANSLESGETQLSSYEISSCHYGLFDFSVKMYGPIGSSFTWHAYQNKSSDKDKIKELEIKLNQIKSTLKELIK